jgi:hypothetical protein
MSFRQTHRREDLALVHPEYDGKEAAANLTDKILVREKLTELKSQIPSLNIAEQFLVLADEIRLRRGSKKQLRAVMEVWKQKVRALPSDQLAAHLNENIARKKMGKVIKTAIKEVAEGLRQDLISNCASHNKAHPYRNLCDYFRNNPAPALAR